MKEKSTMVSYNFRGHGDHYCKKVVDVSEETLINETIQVFKNFEAMYTNASIVKVGHSKGDYIAMKESAKIMNEHKGRGIEETVAKALCH
jgi:hypothetical protein